MQRVGAMVAHLLRRLLDCHKKQPRNLPGRQLGQIQMGATPTIKPGVDYLTSAEVELVRNTPSIRQYAYGCGVNGTLHLDEKTDIDYLALKDMLLRLFLTRMTKSGIKAVRNCHWTS